MAGHARYTVLLDACVLLPICVCDALLSVAATGIYAAKWTRKIDEEWTRNLESEKGKPKGFFGDRCEQMHLACPDWEVSESAWLPLEKSLSLPDPDDQHVLAAAISGHADCIVTFNLRDFPDSTVSSFGIEVLHPDEFLIAQIELDPLRVLTAFKKMRDRLRNPPFTPESFIDALERNRLPQTAMYLREAAALI